MLRRIRNHFRRIKRRLKSRRFIVGYCAAILLVGSISYASIMNRRHLTVNQASYQPLLRLIASAESSDNYNAYFGSPSNTDVDFTAMSVKQVMQWQANYIAQGSPSDAVGRYQIISSTLSEIIQQLDIDTGETFDAALQDKLAVALLERRGAEHYVNKRLSRHDFAANLAKEWAALPKVTGRNPAGSYYAGDGINASLVEVDEVLDAVGSIEAE